MDALKPAVVRAMVSRAAAGSFPSFSKQWNPRSGPSSSTRKEANAFPGVLQKKAVWGAAAQSSFGRRIAQGKVEG